MEGEADVVIVGGGIVGCATAYYLARRGVQPVLVERGQIAGEQSGKNWGFVRQQGRDPLEVPLMVESNRIWTGLEKELGTDIEWVQGGNLALAADEARLALFEQWLEVARQFGLDTRILRSREVAELIPGMEGSWAGGLYTPSDGHAEPVKATDAFRRAALARGARIYTRCAAEAIETRGGEVSGVVTEQGEVRTTRVVCTAGAWSARLARPLGLRLPQRWVRATVARTNPARPVTPAGVWGPTVAFRQRKDGSFNLAAGGATDHDITLDSFRHLWLFLPNYWKNRRLFRFYIGRPLLRDLVGLLPGSTARRHPFVYDREFETPPNQAKVRRSLEEFLRLFPSLRDLTIQQSWAGYIDVTPDALPVLGEVGRRSLEEFLRLFPSLRDLTIQQSWAGYIDVTPDALPVLGEVGSPRGFIFATGFSGHGFAMGPIVGRLIAELIVDGKPSLDLHGFRFSRFAERAIGKPRSVL